METDTKKFSSPHILVVEDDDSLALLLGYNLESEGYRVSRVDRGDEADTLLQEMVPDLVILDWMLPGVSGFELCRRLRGRDGGSELPIILLTARGEETDRIRGLSIGADDYVVKPFSVPELMARVKALLRRARPERIAEFRAFYDEAVANVQKESTRRAQDQSSARTEA
jgi:two-component system phosphate regulon response regulator PhoB